MADAADKAEAEAESLRARLGVAEEDAAVATRKLAYVEGKAERSAQQIGVWRRRSHAWKMRARMWRSRAEEDGEAAPAAQEGDVALSESVVVSKSAVALMGITLAALAEREAMAQERDESLHKWSELLRERTVVGMVTEVSEEAQKAAKAQVEMLRGRSSTVWSSAEAWAVEELNRLKGTYPTHWSGDGEL